VLRQQLSAGREAELHGAYGDTTAFDQHFLADVFFTEPARTLASLHARRAPTFLYRFSIVGTQLLQLLGGAVHGSDYPYVFGYGDGDPSVPDSGELADEVSGCWVSFATSGLPRCGGVTWPAADNGEFLEFTDEGPVARDSDPWQTRLDLVSQIYAGQA
jgi:para-nitrobenzyl esterase